MDLETGSEFHRKTKKDPREQALDDEFLARDYSRDASGNFRMEGRGTQRSKLSALSVDNAVVEKPVDATGSTLKPPVEHVR